MYPKMPLSFTPLAIALCLPMTDAFSLDWSGTYYGGMAGHSVSNKKSHITYNNNNDTPIQGWGNTQFQGNVYNTVESMRFTNSTFRITHIDTLTPSSWPAGTIKDNNHHNMSATFSVLAGINKQIDNIVISGEFKSAFGNFGATSDNSSNHSGRKSGTDVEGGIEPFIFTNYNSVLSGITSPIDESITYYLANYQQNGTQRNAVQFKNKTNFIGRLGYSFGSLMIYGLGGATGAHVQAKTQTTISESATGLATLNYPGTTDFTAQETYYFSGKKIRNMLGYTLGAGLEWDIKNNFLCRIEADYYNLGEINVTGRSSQTSATYNIAQKITGYGFSTGIIKKF